MNKMKCFLIHAQSYESWAKRQRTSDLRFLTIQTIQCPLKWSVTLKPTSSMQTYENLLQWIKMNWLHNMVKLWAERQMSVELQPAVQTSRVELSSAYVFDTAANRCIVAIIIQMNSCKCKLQIYRCNDNDSFLQYKTCVADLSRRWIDYGQTCWGE